ncbi:MAG TPA: gamma-glutamyl-gamma-aminobutyrate hydrolase family protein [Candidatus Nitrosocosmicus sp.]|nr:gamma-glutamyl-gamma-aminobutyrate hydrolase family protein [Candidatus Nitrosocosmicus sp.]
MANIEGGTILVAAPRDPRSEIPKEFLREGYTKGITEAGMTYDVVYPGMTKEEIQRKYQMSNGLLVVGGYDWNANRYGQTPSRHNDSSNDEQDENELMLLEMALNDGMPTLGICRGEQGQGIVLAKAYDALIEDPSLFIQHVPDITDVVHNVQGYADLENNTHEVDIEEDTIAHEIFNANKIVVPSGHHQVLNEEALKNISALVISGRSSIDRLVEIIELKSRNQFYFGMQAHPEVFENLRKPLFKRFAKEARRFARLRVPKAA